MRERGVSQKECFIGKWFILGCYSYQEFKSKFINIETDIHNKRYLTKTYTFAQSGYSVLS